MCCVAWRAAGTCLPHQAVHRLLGLEAWAALIFISPSWIKHSWSLRAWVLRERFCFRPETIQGPCIPKSCIRCCLFLGFDLRVGKTPKVHGLVAGSQQSRLSPRIQGEREPERRVYSVRGRDSRVGEMGRGRKEGESRKLYSLSLCGNPN